VDRYLYQKSLDPNVITNAGGPRAPSAALDSSTTTAEWIQDSSDNLKASRGNSIARLSLLENKPAAMEQTTNSMRVKSPPKWRNFYAEQEKELYQTIQGLDSMLNQRKEFYRRFEAESAADILSAAATNNFIDDL
jgi:hypothetical protein